MSRHRLRATGPDHRDGPPLISDTRAVLVIARSPARAGEIVGALQSRGMLAMQAVATREAFVWARTVPPRLVLLDLEVRGSQILLHQFRAQGRGVIALSDDADRRRAALEAGCLDALHYSDSAAELALHIGKFVRRPGIPRVGRITCGPLDIDLGNRRVLKNGNDLRLSPRQFDFVAYNAARPAQLTPAMALLQDVWSEETDTRKVHLMAHRVRRRLGEPVDSKFFVGRRGYGYGFFPDGAATGSAGMEGSEPGLQRHMK